MDLKDTKTWVSLAGQRLEASREHRRITGIYAGLSLGLSAAVTLVVYCLDLSIARTSGLGSIGARTMLSTLQTLLPLGINLFLMCLDLGFVAAMLRLSRGQFTSPQTLRLGFDRFWVLLRASLLQGAMYLAVCLPAAYLALAVYMMTPWSASLVDGVMAVLEQAPGTTQVLALDEGLYEQIMTVMEPCLVFCFVFAGVAWLLLSYRLRMVNYILIDKPGTGAIVAIRESRKMMKGNCGKLFRLDLRLWWYYGALALTMAVSYSDVWLPKLGIIMPWSDEAAYWIAYGVYFALTAGVYLLLRSRAEVALAFAYDALKPKEEPAPGVVLGNIFQM